MLPPPESVRLKEMDDKENNKKNKKRQQVVCSPCLEKKQLTGRELAERKGQSYFVLWFGEVRVFVVVRRRGRPTVYYPITRYHQIHPVIRGEFGKGHVMVETIGVSLSDTFALTVLNELT